MSLLSIFGAISDPSYNGLICYNTDIKIDLEIAKYGSTEEGKFRGGAGV